MSLFRNDVYIFLGERGRRMNYRRARDPETFFSIIQRNLGHQFVDIFERGGYFVSYHGRLLPLTLRNWRDLIRPGCRIFVADAGIGGSYMSNMSMMPGHRHFHDDFAPGYL